MKLKLSFSLMLIMACAMPFHVTLGLKHAEPAPKKASIVSRYAGPVIKIASGSLLLGYAGGRIWDGISYLRNSQGAHSGWTSVAKALIGSTVPLGILGSILLVKGIKQFKAVYEAKTS